MLSTSEPNILHKIVANPKIIFCHVGCLFMNIQALGVSLGLPHELAFRSGLGKPNATCATITHAGDQVLTCALGLING